MYPGAPTEARHRLLEGFVLRLGRRPDADAFALRGGMLVRQWFPDARRPALDLDLVCRLPFREGDLRERVMAVLAERGVADGVAFRPDRVRFRTLWAGTPAPGLRLTALGTVDGEAAELRVDVTCGLDPQPGPERGLFRAERGSVAVWTSRPEAIAARKLQVIAGLGRERWRPKDLNDVRMLLGRFSLAPRALGESLEAALEGCDGSIAELREAFGRAAWWRGPLAAGRWLRFLHEADGIDAPEDLAAAVAEVRARLAPVLGER